MRECAILRSHHAPLSDHSIPRHIHTAWQCRCPPPTKYTMSATTRFRPYGSCCSDMACATRACYRSHGPASKGWYSIAYIVKSLVSLQTKKRASPVSGTSPVAPCGGE